MGTSDKIKKLEKKLKKISEGDQVRIDRQHKAGKMTARERINQLDEQVKERTAVILNLRKEIDELKGNK